MTELSHVQRVRILYKTILKLHRGLPEAMQSLGDNYVKDEFKRHKTCQPHEANVFLNEWADYAISLAEQLGLRGPATAKPLGKYLKEDDINSMRDEQVYQLYELMMAATKKEKEPQTKDS